MTKKLLPITFAIVAMVIFGVWTIITVNVAIAGKDTFTKRRISNDNNVKS